MNAKECSESCNSLPRIFKERLWFFSNHLPRWEKIERSLTFHCSDFLIIWTLLILASVWRAQLCNTGTVQRELAQEKCWTMVCKKKSRRRGKRKHFRGITTALTIFLWCLENQSVCGRLLLVTKMCVQSGQTSWAVNTGTLIFAVTEVAK